jgi:multidrug resistance efflux pump
VHTGTLGAHTLAPATAVTRRMPLPEDTAQPETGAGSRATALTPRQHNPWPRRAAYIGVGALLMVPVVLIAAALDAPVSHQAVVQARTVPVTAPIAGQVRFSKGADASVSSNEAVAEVVNDQIDGSRLSGLLDHEVQTQERLGTLEVALAKARSEHDRLVRELAAEATPAPERALLKDLHAVRIVELQGQADDLRRRRAQLTDDVAAERQRLAALRQAPVTSPVSGIILATTDRPMVGVGERVCDVIDQDSLTIAATFDAGWAARLSPGMTAQVRIDGFSFPATVRSAPGGGAGPVQVLLDVSPQWRASLRPGAVATVALTGAASSPLAQLGIKLRF